MRVGLSVLAALFLFHAQPAECSTCSLQVCGQGLMCSAGCLCAKDPNQPFGKCVDR